MNGPAIKYRRLGWRTRSAQGVAALVAVYSSLWLGPDHLLSVSRAWFIEEYKRFYFRDIQALTVQKTKRAAVWNGIYGGLAAATVVLFGVLALQSETMEAQKAWLIAGGIIMAVWLVFLALNLIRGPSCVCRVRTAVQSEVLPSLGRVKQARKALAILQPLLEETQGRVSPTEIAQHAGEPDTLARQLPPSRGPAAAGGPPPVPRGTFRAGWHLAFFGVLTLSGVVGLWRLGVVSGRLVGLFTTLAWLLIFGLGLMAMIRQRQTAGNAGVRVFTITALGAVLLVFLSLFAFRFVGEMQFAIQHPGVLPTQLNYYSLPGFWTFSIAAHIIELGFGLIGLAMTFVSRSARIGPTPSALNPAQPAETPP